MYRVGQPAYGSEQFLHVVQLVKTVEQRVERVLEAEFHFKLAVTQRKTFAVDFCVNVLLSRANHGV